MGGNELECDLVIYKTETTVLRYRKEKEEGESKEIKGMNFFILFFVLSIG